MLKTVFTDISKCKKSLAKQNTGQESLLSSFVDHLYYSLLRLGKQMQSRGGSPDQPWFFYSCKTLTQILLFHLFANCVEALLITPTDELSQWYHDHQGSACLLAYRHGCSIFTSCMPLFIVAKSIKLNL